MVDYYKNLTESDLNNVLPLNNLFSAWDTYYNAESCDLYFVGIKNGGPPRRLPVYVNRQVTNTSGNVGV
jgi:hypothetical protein